MNEAALKVLKFNLSVIGVSHPQFSDSLSAASNAIDELLSLRTGEGDDELDLVELYVDCIDTEIDGDINEANEYDCLKKIYHTALHLRQQLREARAEVERWRKRAEWLGSCYKDKTVENGRIVIVLDGTKSATYPDDADTIAKLMDNAMKEGGDLSEGLQTSKQQIAALTAERDSLQSQLAAMQAASVEEVEEIVAEFQFRSDMPMNNHAFERMEKLARTLAAQRDSIISDVRTVLSKRWCLYEDFELMTRLNLLETYEPAKRLMEIVAASDGKSGSEVGR